MDTNEYVLTRLAEARLAEARARGAQATRLVAAGVRRPGALEALGASLIRLGSFVRRRPPARAALPGLS